MINCVGCAFNPFLRFCFVIQFCPVYVKCVHKNKRAYAANFSLCWKFIIFLIILCIFHCTNLCIDVSLVVFNKSRQYSQILTLLTESILALGSVWYSITEVCQRKNMLLEFRAIAKIVEKCEYYGISCFITSNFVEKSKRLSFLFIAILILCSLGIIRLTSKDTDVNHYINFARRVLTRITCFCLQAIIGTQLTLIAVCYRMFFKKCFERIKTVLLNHLCRNEIILRSGRTGSESCENLENSLSRLINLYMSIGRAYRKHGYVVQMGFLPWYTTMIIAVVINNSLLWHTIKNCEETNIIFNIIPYIALLGMVVFIVVHEEVSNTVSGLC